LPILLYWKWTVDLFGEVKCMKIMGITAGKKNGNSETVLKEALLACQEDGAEIIMINLHDYHILPCIGCSSCNKGHREGKVECVLDKKDDMRRIMEQMLVQDAVIISVPTYDLMPAGIFTVFANRFITYEAAFLRAQGLMDIKDRVGGLISVGGSTRAWQSMALECLNAAMFTQSIQVVDQVLITQCPLPGQVVLYPEKLERARRLGKNIIKAIQTPKESRKWLGDADDGWCPVCHSNSLSLGEPHWDGIQWKVECQVCGAGGDLEKGADGRWKFVLAENGMDRCRITEEGRVKHMYEIRETKARAMSDESKQLIKDRMEKYKNIKFPKI
jgi:multimeric flavodoxin WrbA